MGSKVVVWAYLVVLSLGTMLNLYMPKTEAVAKESIVIPGEAIRLRILAHSDMEEDQAIKRKVRDAVNAQITLWVQDLTSMEKARTVIKAKLPEIQAIAEEVVREQGSDQSVKVEFGKVQFPTKLYGQFLYPAGEYQAILITLGSGEGANWWCVLYPPLCFLDFSNGVAVSKGFDEEEEEVKAAMAETERVEAQPEVMEEPEFSNDRREAEEKAETGNVKRNTVEKPETVKVKRNTAEKPVVKEEPTDSVTNLALEKQEKELAEIEERPAQKEKAAPVYTAEDEQPVKVKFFVVEMLEKLFN